ncbi:MAG: hypothetical protein R8G33_06925 [Gammaproteobacteria bacterium]|nr:hypothetical protein [Gammaproteobacteria bacterium]
MRLAKPLAILSTVIFIGIAVLASYAAYKIYIQQDLYEEVTRGSYKNYSISESKKATLSEIKKSFSKLDDINSIEASLRDSENVEKKAITFDVNDINKATIDSLMATQIWVFYLCEDKCDWQKQNRWISFKFEEDKLSRVADYELRRWTE